MRGRIDHSHTKPPNCGLERYQNVINSAQILRLGARGSVTRFTAVERRNARRFSAALRKSLAEVATRSWAERRRSSYPVDGVRPAVILALASNAVHEPVHDQRQT